METKNSFTFLRLMLAMMVLFGHTYVIGDFGGDPILRWSVGQISFQELGVKGFFALSGFLLMHSLAVNPSLARFALRRCFRILPAFWMTLFLSSFVVAPALITVFTHGGMGYLEGIRSGNENAVQYFFRNALLYIGQMEIIPASPKQPMPLVINGSLWSLFYEAACYVGLGFAAGMGLVRRRSAIFACFCLLYLLSVIYFIRPFSLFSNTTVLKLILNLALAPSGPCVVLAFVAGATAYAATGGSLPWNSKYFAVTLLVFAAALTFGGANLVWPFALPYLLVSLAGRLPFRKLDDFGDVSYGVYLYSALVQYCLCLFGVQHSGFGIYLGWATVLSIACGAASWFAVERPAIGLGRWVISRSLTATHGSCHGRD